MNMLWKIATQCGGIFLRGDLVVSDACGRYYTNGNVSDLLVTLLPSANPNRIVDLGAGSGSLTIAARSRWANAQIISVDLDPDSKIALSKNDGLVRHRHYDADVLDVELPNILTGSSGKFDVALCNPPYTKIAWRPGFNEILTKAGLEFAINECGGVSSELLFLAQNIAVTKIGGHIGLIVPDTIVSGQAHADLRRFLMREHQLSRVIQLPRKSFHGTDAQAHIVFLQKGGKSNKRVILQQLSEGGDLSYPRLILEEEASIRMDYCFYAKTNDLIYPSVRTCLSDLGVDLKRGVTSSHQMLQKKYPIFHTTNFPAEKSSSYCLPKQLRLPLTAGEPTGAVIAEPGDILLARVDRNLERKILTVAEGRAAISDTVFRMRVPADRREKVSNFFHSNEGSVLVDAVSRGVGAKLLSKRSLMSAPLPTVCGII